MINQSQLKELHLTPDQQSQLYNLTKTDPFKNDIELAIKNKDWNTFFELVSDELSIYVCNKGITYSIKGGLPTDIDIIDVKDLFIKCIKDLGLEIPTQIIATTKITETLKNSNGKAYLKTIKTDNHIDSIGSIVREFRNGTLTITKDGNSWKDRDNSKVVWNYIDRDYNEHNNTSGITSASDLEHLAKAFCTPNGMNPFTDYDKKSYRNYRLMLGASIHRYYDSSQPFAITLLDAREDSSHGSSAKGGRGKGLTAKIIKNSIPNNTFITTEYKKNNHFQWQNVSKKTQTILVDEVSSKDVKALYSIITEPITVEQKNKNAYEISGAGKPRLIITSNYVVGSDVSTQRRLLRFSFTDFFDAKHTPMDLLGNPIIQQYTEEQWSRFDAFMNECGLEWIKYISEGGKVKDLTPSMEENAFQEVLDDQSGFNQFLVDAFKDIIDNIVNPMEEHNEYLSHLYNVGNHYELISFKDIVEAFKRSEDILNNNDKKRWEAAFNKFQTASTSFMKWDYIRTRLTTRQGDNGNTWRWRYSITSMELFLKFIKSDVSPDQLIQKENNNNPQSNELPF
jgi:hypothetical protein